VKMRAIALTCVQFRSGWCLATASLSRGILRHSGRNWGARHCSITCTSCPTCFGGPRSSSWCRSATIQSGQKPAVQRTEAAWLAVPTAALVLEAAKCYRSGNPAKACPFIYPLVAPFLLTGGRADEVLGLRWRT
jgi:hypothetical protein